MPKTAQPLTISDHDLPRLRRWTRASSIRAGLAQRARIVLAAAQGLSNTQIAERVGCSRPAVIRWRDRYAAKGLAGLDDQPRSGDPAPSVAIAAPKSSRSPSSHHPSNWASPTGRPAPWPGTWA
jgi:transposase-like protein